MKQRIVPGQMVDILTLDELKGYFEEAGASRKQARQFRRVNGTMQVSTAGAAQATEDVSPQYDWSIERVTISGPGAVNALVQFYQDEIAPSMMLEVVQVGAAGLYSDSFSNCLHVPANSVLYVAVTGGVANGAVAYNLQVRQVPST